MNAIDLADPARLNYMLFFSDVVRVAFIGRTRTVPDWPYNKSWIFFYCTMPYFGIVFGMVSGGGDWRAAFHR